MKVLGNAAVFVVMYLLFMLPTYVLPYVGSNSSVAAVASVAIDQGPHLAFLLHLGCLAILVLATWFRGAMVDKKWLIIFPILASFFDLMPALNVIPMIPTVMHLLAIILGVMGSRLAVKVAS